MLQKSAKEEGVGTKKGGGGRGTSHGWRRRGRTALKGIKIWRIGCDGWWDLVVSGKNKRKGGTAMIKGVNCCQKGGKEGETKGVFKTNAKTDTLAEEI